MVAAIAVTSILLLSMGSALLLAGRAMPDAHSPTADCLAGADAVEPMLSELQYAIAINQRSARLIEFTVADRSGDGFPEVIHYEWSGTAGDPLTRTYNGGTAVTVIANVQDFSLSYDLQTTSTQVPQGNESAETLLIGYNSSQNLDDYTIQSNSLYSEYFYPVLPANAVSWKVTRVQFYAQQSGMSGSGQTWVQLQTPTTGGLPSGVVLEQKSLQESSLWFIYWQQQLSYTQVSGLAPQQGLCLVFTLGLRQRWIVQGHGAESGRHRLQSRAAQVHEPGRELVRAAGTVAVVLGLWDGDDVRGPRRSRPRTTSTRWASGCARGRTARRRCRPASGPSTSRR